MGAPRYSDPRPTAAPEESVVAVVLILDDKLCLLRRSQEVNSDAGKWHCITGYLPDGVDPAMQAMIELKEETGLTPRDLHAFSPGRTLQLSDPAGGLWRVFTFRGEVTDRRIDLNWEHDSFAWVRSTDRVDGQLVPWLTDVVDAVT